MNHHFKLSFSFLVILPKNTTVDLVLQVAFTKSISYLEMALKHFTSLRPCPLPLSLFSGWVHDILQITCKKARIWTFFWLDRKQYGWFALFRWAKRRHPLVVVHDFSLHFCLRNTQWIHTRIRYEISAGWFALFRWAKTPPSVSCWFQSAFLLA